MSRGSTNEKYMYLIGEFPEGLTNQENSELLAQYKVTGDRKLRDKIIYGNLRLAISYSWQKFNGQIYYQYIRKNEYEDLIQDLSMIILNAVENFDASKSFAFSTFLCSCIHNDFVRRIKKSSCLKNSAKVISFSSVLFKDDKGKDITLEQVIKDEKHTEDKILASADVKIIMGKILPFLPERQQLVFKKYFIEGKKQNEIAQEIGVSQEQISRDLRKSKEIVEFIYNNGIRAYEIAQSQPKQKNMEKDTQKTEKNKHSTSKKEVSRTKCATK